MSSDTIVANVTAMFRNREPWDCSNNVATLGDQCARLTWQCALEIAAGHDRWLMSDLGDACEAMRSWAIDTGAWDREETAAWSNVECLALFIQNVASELRSLGSDDSGLAECVKRYESTDWQTECESPTGAYSASPAGVIVDYYAGC